MATKSVENEFFWFIPTPELGDEKPTAFLVCGLTKRGKDKIRYREMNAQVLNAIARVRSDDLPERLRDAITAVKSDEGFDVEMYQSCVKEIRNIYYKGELKKSLTDPDDIVNAIAGIVDDSISQELDDVIWSRSELTEAESQNFTPSSGCNNVFQTKQENSQKEK